MWRLETELWAWYLFMLEADTSKGRVGRVQWPLIYTANDMQSLSWAMVGTDTKMEQRWSFISLIGMEKVWHSPASTCHSSLSPQVQPVLYVPSISSDSSMWWNGITAAAKLCYLVASRQGKEASAYLCTCMCSLFVLAPPGVGHGHRLLIVPMWGTTERQAHWIWQWV